MMIDCVFFYSHRLLLEHGQLFVSAGNQGEQAENEIEQPNEGHDPGSVLLYNVSTSADTGHQHEPGP